MTAAQHYTTEREARFRDIRTCLTFGVTPHRIAESYGLSPSSIYRQALRHDAPDIAKAFRQAATQDRQARKNR